MSYRVSKDTSIPLNAVIQDNDELFNDEADNDVSWIRKTLLVLTTTPSDWHLLLNEWIQTIDWDAKARSVALPLGHGLTLLLYIIRLLQDNLIRPESYKIASKQDAFDLSRSEKLKEYEYLSRYSLDKQSSSRGSFYATFLGGVSKVFNSMVIILLVVNLILTYKFYWGNFRVYSLFSYKERPASKHVTKRSLKNLNDQYLENLSNGSLWMMISYLFHGSPMADEQTDGNETYYTLEKWVPSKFTSYLFASFCPSCLFFLLLCDISFITALPVILHQIVLHYLIVDRFEERLADEMVIHQALLGDYESKVVKPLTNKMMQDVQVDATPYGEGYVRFLPAVGSTKSPVFKTHSVMGDTILEKFNSQTQEFEDILSEGESHNTIMEAPSFYQSCPHYNAMECRPFRRCQNENSDMRRISTPPGFYSPCISTASGMSSPFHRGERSPTYLGSGQLHYQTNARQHYKNKSRSPLGRSATPKDESERAKAANNNRSK